MNRIPILSAQRRRRILDLPKTPDVHERLLGEMPFFSEVEAKPPPIQKAPPKGQ